jgi:hypothetical protein
MGSHDQIVLNSLKSFPITELSICFSVETQIKQNLESFGHTNHISSAQCGQWLVLRFCPSVGLLPFQVKSTLYIWPPKPNVIPIRPHQFLLPSLLTPQNTPLHLGQECPPSLCAW